MSNSAWSPNQVTTKNFQEKEPKAQGETKSKS